MTKRITSIDISRIAGVSQTTVSLVLRGKSEGRVSPEVAKRVMEIANKNNYRVNRIASSLRSGTPNNIALIVPDSENPFYGRILHNLQKAFIDEGYFCILFETDNNPIWYKYIENAILGGEIDIAIVCYTDTFESNASINDKLISINDSFRQHNSISIDFYSCVIDAICKFKNKNYNQVIHVKSDINKETFRNRQKAYKEGCKQYNYKTFEITASGLTYHNLYSKMEQVSKYLELPSAFIADDDLLVSGIYRYAKEHNLIIGKDIGIIGIDDIFVCDNYYPKLSSFGYDISLLVEMIKDLIDNIHKKNKPKHFKINMTINDGKSF